MAPLLRTGIDYDPQVAGEIVRRELVMRLPHDSPPASESGWVASNIADLNLVIASGQADVMAHTRGAIIRLGPPA